MKLKIFASLLFVCAVVFAVRSANKREAFAAAEDFPRGALLYAQTADLPALLKLWNESDFREKYARSENFKAFKNNHLGLKLASRRAEFGAASGFPFDLDALSGLAGSRAAFALYDVGKLEFVFVAPVSDEIFAATQFARHRDNFEPQTLPDGTIVYRASVEADRRRQKQELIFAQARGRFVLATSERLLAQTLNNIGGAAAKNRLSDEPAFAALAEKIEPRAATVWVDQAALNEDYYFKRYWLMSEAKDLKNIRAGIFDLAHEDGKIVERRKFLLREKSVAAPISRERVGATLSFVPENVPFYRLRKVDAESTNRAVENTLFDRAQINRQPERENNFYPSSFESFGGGSSYRDYDYLSENFDEMIDDAGDADEKTIEKRGAETDFSKFFAAANPQAVLTFAEPRVSQPAPLFVEFRRAAIFNLSAPAAFRRGDFEAAAAAKFSAQATIRAADVRLKWTTRTENGFERRSFELPMSNFAAHYAVRGDFLILTNDAELLRKIIENQNPQTIENFRAPLTDLTVVNLDRTESAYTEIFAELEERGAADDFFTGSVASLLASLSEVKKIEIKRGCSGEFLDETITVSR